MKKLIIINVLLICNFILTVFGYTIFVFQVLINVISAPILIVSGISLCIGKKNTLIMRLFGILFIIFSVVVFKVWIDELKALHTNGF